jgi:hypothetical protein
MCEKKPISLRPKMSTEPRLGMGKGKSSKNMTYLVIGSWRTLATGLSLVQKQIMFLN